MTKEEFRRIRLNGRPMFSDIQNTLSTQEFDMQMEEKIHDSFNEIRDSWDGVFLLTLDGGRFGIPYGTFETPQDFFDWARIVCAVS